MMPPEMMEAFLLVETGWSPSELDNAPEELVSQVLLYKAVKNVAQNGGELQL